MTARRRGRSPGRSGPARRPVSLIDQAAKRRHPDGRDHTLLRFRVGAPRIPHVDQDGSDVVLRYAHDRIAHTPAGAVAAGPAVPAPVPPPRIAHVDVRVRDRDAPYRQDHVGRIGGVIGRQPGVAEGRHVRGDPVENELIVVVIERKRRRDALRRHDLDHRIGHHEGPDGAEIHGVIVGRRDDVELGLTGRRVRDGTPWPAHPRRPRTSGGRAGCLANRTKGSASRTMPSTFGCGHDASTWITARMRVRFRAHQPVLAMAVGVGKMGGRLVRKSDWRTHHALWYRCRSPACRSPYFPRGTR